MKLRMGKNKRERKVVESLLEHIAIHERKIVAELAKLQPNAGLISKWRTEIRAAERTIARRVKRLPGGKND